MSIHKKISLATFIALSLAACGGGGGSSPSTAATPTSQSASATTSSGSTAQAVDVGTIEINGTSYTIPAGEVTTLKQGDDTIRAYRQQYSIIAGSFTSENYGDGTLTTEPMSIAQIKGQLTQTLPSTGSYTYNGKAFSHNETGALAYNVNFDTRKGSGSVTGISETGTITLQEASIKNTVDAFGTGQGIEGKAAFAKDSTSGDYRLKFYGPNAEEIAGTVYHHNGEIGVAGSR